MKKIVWLLIFIIGCQISVFAQCKKLSEEKRNAIETQKVAFITQDLQLNSDEAAKFWPLYNEMHKKICAEKNKISQIKENVQVQQNLNEPEYISAIQNITQIEQNISDIRKTYYIKMIQQNNLPAAKVWRIPEAEHNFHKALFGKHKH